MTGGVARLRGLTRARLWRDQEIATLRGPVVAQRTLGATSTTTGEARSVAVEVVIPRGPVVSYALLGASFQPSGAPSSSLHIAVISGDNGQPFPDGLASPPDQTLVGLPTEYIEPVMAGVLGGVAVLAMTPSGSLTFNQAAYGRIGSNSALFRQLAAGVTRVTLGDQADWEDILRQEID